MGRRNTIQKELVLHAVRSMKSHVTAEEVYAWIIREHPSVGKGTVYRNLHILAEEGEIRKVEIPGGPDRYDFTVKEHYHAKCVKCNKIFDVDRNLLTDFKDQMYNMHGNPFIICDILIQGVCPECQ